VNRFGQMATPTTAILKKSGFPVEVAVRHICTEHRNLARVFKVQESHAKAIAKGECAPDLLLFAALLRYLDSFSYGVHHPAEENYLFPAIRQSGAPAHVIDNALVAHNVGAKKLAALQGAFEVWQNRPRLHNPAFLELVPDYVSFEFDHMFYEESVVLPCALENLSAADWAPIAAAFCAHDDPIFGTRCAPVFASLHRMLTGRPATH
jgi:hemerythrin-like domain-containing protein